MFVINGRYKINAQLDKTHFVDFVASDLLSNQMVLLRMCHNMDVPSHQALIAMAHFIRKHQYPKMVKLLDCGLDVTHHPDVMAYMVFEKPRGIRLDRYLEQYGPLSIEQSTQVLRQLICGLEHAHKQGIYHGNLKTKNIWLDKKHGQCKVCVTGFGESMDWSSDRPEYTRFTPAFGAPEQFTSDHPVGAYTDIYALGLIMLHCLGAAIDLPYDRLVWMRTLNACHPMPKRLMDGQMGRVLTGLLTSNISRDNQPMRLLNLAQVVALLEG